MANSNPAKVLASRVAMLPRDTNGQGHIFGGVLLSLIDLAGADIALNACPGVPRVVTRAMDQVEFQKPVLVNDIVTCYGTVTRMGKTSISVHIDVEVDRQGELIPVTAADLVFVAVDEDGNKVFVACGQSAPSHDTKPARDETRQSPDSSKRVLAMRKMMLPADTNGMGNIFGGVLLSFIDLAGSYVARRACANGYIHRCVTRFMDKVEFKRPVHVNDVITCWGTVTKLGTTSVSVHVDVEATRNGEILPVTSADLVFVAVDEQGRPTAVACSAMRQPQSVCGRLWSALSRLWRPRPAKRACSCDSTNP